MALSERMALPGAPRSTFRAIAAAQAAGAAVLAFTPEQALRLCGDDRRNAPPAWIVRLLGARQLVQAAVQFAEPTPRVAFLGALADATHAASMLPVITFSRRFRRAALISGGYAAASAGVLGTVASRKAGAA
jgi:hypothetical protein